MATRHAIPSFRMRLFTVPVAETALLAGIRETLLSEAAFQRFQRGVTAELKRATPDPEVARRRVSDAERVQGNILAALRARIITASTKAELLDAERLVASARAELAALQSFQPSQILPRAREAWRGVVSTLADHARNLPEARNALRELLGENVMVRNENGELFAEIAGSDCQLKLVAGAGFEPATFGL
jgi:site-specific DNA recombinase